MLSEGFWSQLKGQILADSSNFLLLLFSQPRCSSCTENLDACVRTGGDGTQGVQDGGVQWIKGPNTRSWWANGEQAEEELVWLCGSWKLRRSGPDSLQATGEAASGRAAAQQGSHGDDVEGHGEGRKMDADQIKWSVRHWHKLELELSRWGRLDEELCWKAHTRRLQVRSPGKQLNCIRTVKSRSICAEAWMPRPSLLSPVSRWPTLTLSPPEFGTPPEPQCWKCTEEEICPWPDWRIVSQWLNTGDLWRYVANCRCLWAISHHVHVPRIVYMTKRMHGQRWSNNLDVVSQMHSGTVHTDLCECALTHFAKRDICVKLCWINRSYYTHTHIRTHPRP